MIAGGRRIFAIAAVLFVAGIAVSPFLGTWTDEEYTLASTAHGPAYALARAYSFELQAPLYFVLESMWRLLNSSVGFARSSSVIAYAAFVLILGRLGARYVPARDPSVFVAIAALNPYAVFAALDIRLYALALLLSGLLWLAFERGYLDERKPAARIAFVVIAIAGTYTHYFFAFALVGMGACLLVYAGPRRAAAYALECIPVAIAVLPLALAARGQAGGMSVPLNQPLWLVVVKTAINPWLNVVFPFDSADWGNHRFIRAFDLTIVAATIAYVAFARVRPSRRTLSIAAAVAAIDAVYVALVLFLRVPMSERYYFPLFVPVALATYAYACDVATSSRPHFVRAFAVCALLAAVVLVAQERALAQPGDWQRVAAYLRANADAGDAIVIYPADAQDAFDRWYRPAPLPVIPFPRPTPPGSFSDETLSVESDDAARAAFGALRSHKRVWFVDAVTCLPAPVQGCDLVHAELPREASVVNKRNFFRSSVSLLEWRPSEPQ